MKIELFKKVSVFALIMAFSCIGFAQQQAQFSQYMFNRLSYNPAYAGSVGSICFSGLYRNQWMGLTLTSPGTGVKEGATPQNILFSFDMPVNFLHGGIGLSVLTNKLGYYSAINIGFDYAYRFPGMNKVLQAAGRVIRTENDTGVIALLDERFDKPDHRRMYPREWKRIIKITEGEYKPVEDFWKAHKD